MMESSTPLDFVPKSQLKDKTDKARWTHSRKVDFSYYEKMLADQPRTGKLLDVGCGLGQFRELFTQFDYHGFDIYPYQWVKVIADFTKPFPIQSESYNIVILSNVLEHTPDPWTMVRESFRVLKTNGVVVGSVPFFAEVHEEPYDFLRYTDIMLKKLFSEAGFKKVEVVPLERPIDIYRWNQSKFFKQLAQVGGWRGKLFIKLTGWMMHHFRNTLALPKSDRVFTRRYGFRAIK